MPHHKSLHRRIVYISAFVLILTTAPSAQERKRNEGDMPYTPSRLEWLAVDLNAQLRTDLTETTGYQLQLIPIAGRDTILIFVRYLPSVDREAMNMGIDAARKVIAIESKSYGWSTWLRVKERVEMARPDVPNK